MQSTLRVQEQEPVGTHRGEGEQAPGAPGHQLPVPGRADGHRGRRDRARAGCGWRAAAVVAAHGARAQARRRDDVAHPARAGRAAAAPDRRHGRRRRQVAAAGRRGGRAAGGLAAWAGVRHGAPRPRRRPEFLRPILPRPCAPAGGTGGRQRGAQVD